VLELLWLEIRSSNGILQARLWTFGLHKSRNILMAERLLLGLLRRKLLLKKFSSLSQGQNNFCCFPFYTDCVSGTSGALTYLLIHSLFNDAFSVSETI
jgi:hypothetical protein